MLFRLRLGFRPDGQCVNFIARRLLCQAQVIGGLQIEPEFRGGFEPVAEAQGGVAGDRPFAGNDLADTVLRHVELLRELLALIPILRNSSPRISPGCVAGLVMLYPLVLKSKNRKRLPIKALYV
jgi:hypothetical protein